MFIPKPLVHRLMSKVIPEALTGCWIWTGSCLPTGYGYMQHKNKRLYTHRASYMIHIGEIPEGKFVLHRCDNPSCCNPNHLFIGDQRDNILDCLKKGRQMNQNTKRTHCKNGHLLSGDNLRVESTGFRRCKICRQQWERNYKK